MYVSVCVNRVALDKLAQRDPKCSQVPGWFAEAPHVLPMLLLSRGLLLQLCQRLFATNASALQRWQRRCDRLTQLQRRIKFKPVESFTVSERTFVLPLSKAGPSLSACPSQNEMEYLVGFFDGDGCVSMTQDTGRIELQVGQTLDAAKVLIRFRDILGGGVYHLTHATGTKKAMLAWRASGNTMRQAAKMLGRLPSMKQEQLQIAADGRGSISKEDRAQVSQRMWLLKQKEHVPARFNVSWPYFAGFFDAEGSITINATGATLILQIDQINPFVLKRLQDFLHLHGLHKWKLGEGYGNGCFSKLACSDSATCKLTLQRLLDSGLDLKYKQATLALSLTRQNHQAVREDLFNLNGFNKRYQRLDNEGIARAKEIKKVSEQLRHASSQHSHDTLQRKVQELREEHLLQNLITKCQRLRRDIRVSLGEGGLVSSQI